MDMKSVILDAAVILILPILAAATTIVFSTNLFVSVLLFLALPALYLLLRNPDLARKSIFFALLFSIPLSLFVDTLAAINGAWIVPETIFPIRILGVSTIEVYLFGLFWVLFSVLFYEYFFDKGKKGDGFSPTVKYLIYFFIVLSLSVVAVFFSNAEWLRIPYVYFIMGTGFVIIPVAIFLFRYPKFLGRYLMIGLYFFSILLLFEIVALHNKQWIFPGQFIGFVQVYGYQFPIEELVIWMIFATPALLSWYEFFADDRKIPNQTALRGVST